MKKLSAFFLVLFFLSSLPCNSMQMLSIEKGKVYIDDYSLSHILQESNFSINQTLSDSFQSVNSNRLCQHLHIILTKTCLDEKQDFNIENPANKVFSLNPVEFLSFLSSPSPALLVKHYIPLTKFPTLLKTTVLLV